MAQGGIGAVKPNGGDGDSIQIFVRVRPPARDEGDVEMGNCLTVDTTNNAVIMKSKPDQKVFTFDQVADVSITQESVFSSVAKKMIDSCLAGYNGTIFAYGQTGSGKTFTMIGPSEDSFHQELRGLIPRSFEYLFGLVNRQKELLGDKIQFCCRASFLEIYNEQIFDLLDAGTTGLMLRENIKRGVFVDGLSEQIVNTASDAYDVLQSGWTNRSVASTSMNRESSRSHAVFTLQIESKENKQGTWQMRSSQLNLVDLAGSERQKDTKTAGIRLREGCSINKSLSSLGNVIMALVHVSHDKNRHVPYRDSKLTFLLRDSLGGNAKTHIIACVHPGNKCFGETLSTLQFARRAKQIKNKAMVNEDVQGDVTALQTELKKMREELAAKDKIISELQASGGVSSSTDSSGAVSEVWVERFEDAMRMYETSASKFDLRDKKHQLIDEQLKQKDRKILQTKMILQFRNDTLKRWEAERKKQLGPGSEDLVLALRQEIKALEEYNSSKHDLQVVRQEKKMLEHEIEALHQQIKIQDRRQAELIEIYEAQKDKDVKRPVLYTPQHNDTEEPVSTVERQKSQLAKLQAEMETLKRSFSVEKDELKKKLMETESSLTSVKAAKEELENSLKQTQQRATIERENQEKLHMDTIKTITTPKKAKYQLRNRLIMAPGSCASPVPMSALTEGEAVSPPTSSPTSPPPITDIKEEDGLQEMTMPPEMFEEQIEGLTKEIQTKLKENAELVLLLEQFERKVIDSVEENSRIVSLNTGLEKKSEEERKLVEQLQGKMNVMERERDGILQAREFAESELEDLRLVIKQTDKQFSELREERDALKQSSTSAESQVSSLSYQLEETEQRNGDLLIALNSTKEDMERLQSELQYTQHQSQELENRLQSEISDHAETRKKLEMLGSNLEKEQATAQQLKGQLEEQGTEKEKQLLGYIEQQKATESELSMTRQQLGDTQEQLSMSDQQLAASHSACLHMEKGKKEIEETLIKVSAERNRLREEDKSLRSELEDSRTQISQIKEQLDQEALVMEAEMEQIKEECHQQVSILSLQLEEKETQICHLQVQKDMAQEDLEEYKNLEEALQARVQELQAEIDKQKVDNAELHILNEKLLGRITELDSKIAQTEEREEKFLELVEKEQDLRCAREDISYLSKQVEEREKHFEEFKKETDEIEEKLRADVAEKEQTIEYWRQLAANSQTQYNDMSKEKMNLELRISQKEIHIKERDTIIESNRIKVEQAADLTEKLDTLTDEISALKDECTDKDEQIDRLRAVTTKDQEQIIQIKSDLEVQHEMLRHVKSEKQTLREKLDKVETEAARLAGHSNINQKIQYVQQLKETNSNLTQANSQLEIKVIHMEKELRHFRLQTGSDFTRRPQTPLRSSSSQVVHTEARSDTPKRREPIHEVPSKENMDPAKM